MFIAICTMPPCANMWRRIVYQRPSASACPDTPQSYMPYGASVRRYQRNAAIIGAASIQPGAFADRGMRQVGSGTAISVMPCM
jgi:hypothetical protein